MKIKSLLFFLALLMCGTQMQGQFLKKLKKKLEQVTEDVVINKTSEKVAQSLDKTLDSILGLDGGYIFDGNIGGISMVDASILPDIYHFEWKYTLQVESPKSDPMKIVYYLKRDEKYFGMQPNIDETKNKGELMMVMDMGRNINAIFMTNNNKKTGMVMTIPNDIGDYETDENLASEYTFEELDDKVINGRNCKGFKMENEDSVMIMYNDMEAPVSFSKIFGINIKNVPKGFNPKWLDKAENSLVMEATYTDKKKNESTTMRCLDLSKQDLDIKKKDYEFSSLGISGN
ncbi:DUF4412 domain-containing protein [Formosa sp. PL04]|uniref:DUF4412 domain-containing protein n=1 Tax=Formosa sp. PL04 TaxID=3081755 RepID=UPI0029813D02|nr:DUF4412 domain-containing protein [Formosa sp. PL04]MDW5288438.1 DUF4412 domain-containing protein [Formosa sp. PL04]